MDAQALKRRFSVDEFNRMAEAGVGLPLYRR